jgi:hypothetical protein
MSIKSKVLAGAAALTMISGMGAIAAAGTANAATPSCGYKCVDVFSRAFGTHNKPGFVLDVLRQGNKVGQPVILFRAANNDPAEDFTVENQGLVSDFETAGLVSKSEALHYGGLGCKNYHPTYTYSTTGRPTPTGVSPSYAGPLVTTPGCGNYYPDLEAYQIEYSPYGVGSGLCVGTSSLKGTGPVSLQPCGVAANTVWITDYTDVHGFTDNYVPLINGAQTNFSNPWVLTYPQNGYPTDMPRPQLTSAGLQTNSRHTLSNFQLWGADRGPLNG